MRPASGWIGNRRDDHIGHFVWRSLTGAAMNPARVFGPAVAANYWRAHYVYWIGPLLGGALGGVVYRAIERKPVEAGP
jgi:glycerol uptake facilitator-like aquaporin